MDLNEFLTLFGSVPLMVVIFLVVMTQYVNRSGNRGKLNAISTGSISGGVPYSMGVEASFHPWFQAGMCPSSAMT